MTQQFHKPASIEEALALKESHGEAITWFAGGAFLNHIDCKDHFNQFICLEQLQLNTIKNEDNQLIIGALANLQDIVDNEITPNPLRHAIRDAAVRTLRNLTTIGGDVAMGGMITKLTPCLIALKSTIVLGNNQEMSLEDYLKEDKKDLIVTFKIPSGSRITEVLKVSHQANSEPVCTIAVGLEKTPSGDISNLIIAVGSIEEKCRRMNDLESAIQAKLFADHESIQKAVYDFIRPKSDLLGSAVYKTYITAQAVADCVMACLKGEA
jgi:putative selenate reductase FAD-binding subunit